MGKWVALGSAGVRGEKRFISKINKERENKTSPIEDGVFAARSWRGCFAERRKGAAGRGRGERGRKRGKLLIITRSRWGSSVVSETRRAATPKDAA